MGNGGKRKMMLAATVAALAIGVAPAIADARPASSVVAGSVTLGGAGKAAYAKTDSAGSIASRLPQTGDANLALPLVFAGIIGVALLGAGIALLFDKRK